MSSNKKNIKLDIFVGFKIKNKYDIVILKDKFRWRSINLVLCHELVTQV